MPPLKPGNAWKDSSLPVRLFRISIRNIGCGGLGSLGSIPVCRMTTGTAKITKTEREVSSRYVSSAGYQPAGR